MQCLFTDVLGLRYYVRIHCQVPIIICLTRWDFTSDMILCVFNVLHISSENILLCVPFLFEVTLEPEVAWGTNLIGIPFFARRLAFVVACPTGRQRREHRQADEALGLSTLIFKNKSVNQLRVHDRLINLLGQPLELDRWALVVLCVGLLSVPLPYANIVTFANTWGPVSV